MKYLKIITYKRNNIKQKIVTEKAYYYFWEKDLEIKKKKNIIEDYDVQIYSEQLEIL